MDIRVDLTKGVFEPPEMYSLILEQRRARVFLDGVDVSDRCVAANTKIGQVKLQVRDEFGNVCGVLHPDPHVLMFETVRGCHRHRGGRIPYEYLLPMTDIFLFQGSVRVLYCYRYGKVEYRFLDAPVGDGDTVVQ